MKKLKMHTPDMTVENIDKVAAIFPNCLVETKDEKTGEVKRAIDFDQLRQELSDRIVDGPRERYRLDWPGKREALLAANAPIAKTLRPCREESVEFDATKNLFIEGDNLDALKLLQETYLDKVKLIYIDPPYNTGEDFLYDDDFSDDAESYLTRSNQRDEVGNRMVGNPESSGRFHSDWLSMMAPRLRLARTILRDDGIIFISIGSKEVNNLVTVCDEVFGAVNRIAVAGRLMKRGGNKGKFFSPNIEYLLVYAKSIDSANGFRCEMDAELIRTVYTKIQKDGERKGERYRAMGLYQSSLDPMRGCSNQRYYIKTPDGSLVIPPGDKFPNEAKEGSKVKPSTGRDGVWRWTYEKYLEEKVRGNVEFAETGNDTLVGVDGSPTKWNINTKIWLKERQEEGQLPVDFIGEYENRQSAKELKALGIDFEFAKPVGFIQHLIKIVGVESGETVLDFFAGSATTADAVMQLNSLDQKKRRFIMIQLPEPCQEKYPDFKSIADISKERIRRAGIKIKEKTATSSLCLDIGFRVLKVDTSSMTDVYYAPDMLKQTDLVRHTDNIKPGRSPEDLLFQVLLDWGVDLSLPIVQETVAKKKVFFVDGNALVACFDSKVSEDLVKELAKRKPLRAVFRDSSYDNDSVKINVVQIFKLLSPETEVKTL
jgi:adenine-specific DNA-methyltransferase